jgi:hypothetical protein
MIGAARIVFGVTLWVRSPFLFRGLSARNFGVDSSQLRDENNRPIIPGDQFRGVLREALCDLAAVGAGIGEPDIDDLFGRASHNEGKDDTSNDPLRGKLLVSDLTAIGMVRDPDRGTEEGLGVATETTRIEIDDDLGAARQGMLQVVELVAPFGAAVRFSGEIVAFCPEKTADDLARLLNKAVKLVSAIGAFKSPGFGEVIAERSTIVRAGEPRTLALPPRARNLSDFLTLRVRFDRPFLVDAEWIAGNAFRGSAVVPGSVFKGALARRLDLAELKSSEGDVGRALSQLSVSHAFPESKTPGTRGGLPLPLSLVAAEEAHRLHVGDALHVPPGKGAMILDQPAIFRTDWKQAWYEREELHGALRRPEVREPCWIARTHTAIQNGIAKDEALFTSIACSAKDSAWLVDIDRGAITDPAVQECAGLLLTMLLEDGLDNIGKTGARAFFEHVADTPPYPEPIEGHANRYAIVLATPALMLDPATVFGVTLHDAYAAYWKTVLGGATLHSFYAAQQLTGGYLARRRRLYGGDTYFPFLLTEAGSIFEIESDNPAELKRLWRYGLPPVHLSNVRAPVDWAHCPYLRENGYGRIFAHLTAGQEALLRDVRHV